MTAYSVLVNLFLRKVEKDKSFFKYFNLSDDQAMELAEQQSLEFLDESINRLIFEGDPEVDFTDRDDEAKTFNFDLVPSELYLIPSLMYEVYLERDIPTLKLQNVNFTPTELRVFDPSNARDSFMRIYSAIKEENAKRLGIYRDTSRTGGYIGLDYGSYDTEG